MVGRLTAAWPIAVVCGAVALLASAFLYGTPSDEEEFRFAILSAWIRVRGVASGEYPFWFSHLGFGVPQPFVPSFGLHPLTPLLAALSPVAWVRLFLLAHTAAGAVGMWLVCRRLKLAAVVRAVCVVTYLLAAPVQNYLLSDFWPSHHLVWTSVPFILLIAWHLLDGNAERSWRSGLALGVGTGLTIANANPSYAAVFAALPMGMLATYPRAIRRQWAALTLAIGIAAAIVAPVAAHLIVERGFFPSGLGLSNVPEPLRLSRVLESLWRPFGELQDARTLFIGAPFTILALVGCVWMARVRRDLVLAAAISALMVFTVWIPVPVISQRYQFRDPLTLCAILLAGCAADRLWQRRGTRTIAALALVLQTAVIVATAWPLIAGTWEPEGLRAAAFQGATGNAQVSDGVVAAMRAPGRLLYSPRVDRAVAERALVDDGLGLNALTYRGVAVVNGSFKAVSTDTLWPNDRLFYGWIRTPQALVDSDASLDVLGIRYVLSYRGEPVASGLREIWSGTTIRGAELVLFENPDAGPGAFLIDPARIDPDLPLNPACGHDRLLCRDAGALRARRDRDVAAIEREVNEIRMAWPPVAQPRILVVTEMYRPEWKATSGTEALHVRPLYGGFIGVGVPPGVSSVRLAYRPRAIMAASIVCYAALTLALAALAVTVRRPAARDASKPIGAASLRNS